MKTTPLATALGVLCLFFTLTASDPSEALPDLPVASKTPVDALFSQAVQLKKLMKYDSAALLLQTVGPTYKSEECWEQYLECQSHLAFCLWITHRSEEAVALCKEAIETGSRQLDSNHIHLAKLYTVLGNVHADRRSAEDYKRGVYYFEKALAITRHHYGDRHPALADAYERLGIARYLIDDYGEAVPFYEKALTFLAAPSPDNVDTYAKIHNNLGLIYLGMGHFPKALQNFEKAKALVGNLRGKEDPRMVKFSINIAQMQLQMGDFTEALFTLEQARALDAKVGESGSKLSVYLLGGIGDCYLAKGAYRKAADYYRQCLEYWNPDKRDDINAVILELSRIGVCYLRLGDTEQALEYFQKAQDYLNAYYDQDNLNWVDLLVNLGLARQQKGDFLLAEQYFQRALAISQQKVGKKHPTTGKIQTNLAKLYLQQDQLEEAFGWAEKANAAFLLDITTAAGCLSVDRINNLPDYIALLELTGLIKTRSFVQSTKIADLQQAREAFCQGLAFSDSLKLRLQSGPAMEKSQKQVFSLAENALDCLYALWQITQDKKYLEEAFVFFEKSKSDWLRASARDWLGRQHANIPKDLVERELALKSQLEYYRDLRRNRPPSTDPQAAFKAEVWQDRLFEVKKQLDLLLSHLKSHYPAYYRLKYDNRVASPAEIQAFNKLTDSELLTYFWGEETVYVMAIGRDSLRWVKLPPIECIEGLLAGFQQSINSGKDDWQSDEQQLAAFHTFQHHAYALYTTLLQPVLSEKSPTRLILVPDGPLGRLPFQILMDVNPGQEAVTQIDYRNLPYLIRNRAIQYEYAASLLLQQNIQNRGKGYIGFSPSFDGNPANYAVSRGHYPPTTGLSSAFRAGESWAELAFNRAEVAEAAAIVGGKKFNGPAATEHNFRKVAGGAQILHLATHAITHDTEPDYSALIFAQDPVRPEDGQLHAYELYNLPLRADLAVLSACNTGSGKLRRGEGVMSLSRAFQYAGCPSVLMSLWPANDATTKAVVVDFFSYLKTTSSKSEALQKASLDYLANIKADKLAHPFYWANFVIVGKDNPIRLEEKNRGFRLWTLFAFGAGCLSLAGWGWGWSKARLKLF